MVGLVHDVRLVEIKMFNQDSKKVQLIFFALSVTGTVSSLLSFLAVNSLFFLFLFGINLWMIHYWGKLLYHNNRFE